MSMHLELFWESRGNAQFTSSDPANNPNTELTSVPEEADIHFRDGPTRRVTPLTFKDKCEKPSAVARLLLGRAMLDADATVVPIGQ